MGFTINKEIKTKLTCKEISLMTVAMSVYVKAIGNKDPEWALKCETLINRLSKEMYAYPVNDFTK